MKTYYLIITLLSVVGVSLLLSYYPVIVGLVSFGLAIGYKKELHKLKEKEG